MAALIASGKGDVSSHATFHVLKTGNFEQGWVGETEAGRVWGSPVHGGVPHSQFSRRLCHWLLPKLLTRLFLGVQLHRGQLEMVLRAARTVRSPAGRSQPPECRELTPGSLACSPRCLWCSCAATSPRWMGCSCPSCSSPRGSGCPGWRWAPGPALASGKAAVWDVPRGSMGMQRLPTVSFPRLPSPDPCSNAWEGFSCLREWHRHGVTRMRGCRGLCWMR